MSTTQTTEAIEPTWITVSRGERHFGTGPIFLAEADVDGSHFTACISTHADTTKGYELDVASSSGPSWSTHADTLAEAKADFARYLNATPPDEHDQDATDALAGTEKENNR
ncbi:hypothetical protein ACIA03_28990 [Nocardioides sp. NPDC051685]|uniref:hypothetical protein n=1 Tax=Nocardioides sp. NPDC051685 TaxID=3364334 RepID=UPI0037B189B6